MRIERYNWPNVCSEEFCSRKATYISKKTIDGIKVVIPLCAVHFYLTDTHQMRIKYPLLKKCWYCGKPGWTKAGICDECLNKLKEENKQDATKIEEATKK